MTSERLEGEGIRTDYGTRRNNIDKAGCIAENPYALTIDKAFPGRVVKNAVASALKLLEGSCAIYRDGATCKNLARLENDDKRPTRHAAWQEEGKAAVICSMFCMPIGWPKVLNSVLDHRFRKPLTYVVDIRIRVIDNDAPTGH